jgi:N-acetyl sugar amidotransferase
MAQTICKQCILDTTSKLITFDETGVCNFCRKFESEAAEVLHIPSEIKKKKFDRTITRIKERGKNAKYDCILGLSGGVDSSYLAILAKEQGLRPLVVHFDNGWNSELAVKNIENIVGKLGFDLFTYVVDWEIFKEAQKAYIKASVLDMEVPTDMLIFAVLFDIAKKHKIKTILSGTNLATEGVLPRDWSYERKFDAVNFRNIIKQHGDAKILSKFPYLGFYRHFIYRNYYQIELTPLLNLVDYKKMQVKQRLMKELDWQDYGGKHYESIWTRFYQGYILPKKFNIDKRKAHLSNLILNNEITREEAIEEVKPEPYPKDIQQQDKEYVCKKFDFTIEEFDRLMALPEVPHASFGQETDAPWKMKWFEKLGMFFLFQVCYRFGFVANPYKQTRMDA